MFDKNSLCEENSLDALCCESVENLLRNLLNLAGLLGRADEALRELIIHTKEEELRALVPRIRVKEGAARAFLSRQISFVKV